MMNIKEKLLKFAFALEKKQDPIYTFDTAKQKKYLYSLNDPKDDFDRSFNQYKCQMYLYPMWIRTVVQAVSLPLFAILLIKYWTNENKTPFRKNIAVFLGDGKPKEIIPETLFTEFDTIVLTPTESNIIIKEDISFLVEIIKRYPISWHFWLKNLIKISRYRGILQKYGNTAFIVCNEYSFTSSILTAFCNQQQVEHVNVMHGEKFFFIRDSFYRFNRCYVWDEHYQKLGQQLRAEKSQFIIEVPRSLLFKNCTEVDKTVDFTYYLASETDEQLCRIASIVSRLSEKGYIVRVRMHPRYSDKKTIRSLFREDQIEDLEKIGIEQSILSTRAAVAVFSTVLQQAYRNGTQVVIDDISNPARYRKLEEIDFFMLKNDHALISSYL